MVNSYDLAPPAQAEPLKKLTSSSSPPARILGIETSCDETAASIVENGQVILSNLVASQAELHAQFGGVFPEVASRQHIRTIYIIVEQALQQAHFSLGDVDAIAVTRGPGLPGSLVVGVNLAKGLALGSGLPLLGVNHLEAHVYSAWLHTIDNHAPPQPKLLQDVGTADVLSLKPAQYGRRIQ